MKTNIALLADSYKFSHYKQYPENTSWIFDYMESRGGKYPVTLFSGLQYFLKEYLCRIVTKEDIEYANERVTKHMGPGLFNYEGWMRIVNEFEGKLPLRIRAVKEGTVLPVKNVLMTIENTHPDFAWLPGQFETLLMKVWAPTTVGTTSLMCKHIIKSYLERTADDLSGLPFKLHDFGDRGVSSVESAGTSGFAHLINFMGTDTFSALEVATQYYDADMAGFSIPATEHSTMTILGPKGEFQQMERFLDQYATAAIKACVSDSYNIWATLDFWATQKQKLKDQNSILVVRPDSGDPIEMSFETIKRLDERFGSVVNNKGYKVLDQVRVIYGDGISNPGVINEILKRITEAGYSADNIAFGMGGGLLQKCDRDTQKFAIKCAAAIVNGELLDVQKDPITDPGKKSKAGILDLVKENNEYKTVNVSMDSWDSLDHKSELETVFENGVLMKSYNLDEIREQSKETYEMYKHLLG